MTPLQLLRSHPVFVQLQRGDLERLARASEVRVYGKKAVCCRQDQAQTHVLLVASGSLSLHRRLRKKQIHIGVLRAPAIFGDAELYADQPWSVTARAGEDAAEAVILAMPNRAFDATVSANAAVAMQLYRDTCARHFLVIQLIHMNALSDTRSRVLQALVEACEPRADGVWQARYSASALARALNLDRKTIHRVMQSLEEGGEVRRTERTGWLELVGGARRKIGRFGLGASW